MRVVWPQLGNACCWCAFVEHSCMLYSEWMQALKGCSRHVHNSRNPSPLPLPLPHLGCCASTSLVPRKTSVCAACAGGIRPNEPDYSNGVRQELHRLFGKGQHPNITIHEGGHPSYTAAMKGSKFCMAPSGHGWGIRLSQYMAQGCVPVIIQVGT